MTIVATGITIEEQVRIKMTWLQKGRKSHFGYRSYRAVNAQDGYVRGVHSAPANQSEMPHFEAAIEHPH